MKITPEEEYKPTTEVGTTLTGLLATGSPYITAARTRGEQEAAKRGLLSSSMAAGASEKAAIEAALPVAQQDARYRQEMGLAEQAGDISSLLQREQGLIQSGHYLTQGEIASGLQQEQAGQTSALSLQEAGQTSALSTQQALAASTLSLQDANQALEQLIQQALSASALSAQEAGQTAGLMTQETEAAATLAAQQAAAAAKLSAQEAGQTSKLMTQEEKAAAALSKQEAEQTKALELLQQSGATDIAMIEAASIMAQLESQEANALAGGLTDLAAELQNDIAAIQIDPNLSETAKTAAIDSLQSVYYANVDMILSVYGAGLEDGSVAPGAGGGAQDVVPPVPSADDDECKQWQKELDAKQAAIDQCQASLKAPYEHGRPTGAETMEECLGMTEQTAMAEIDALKSKIAIQCTGKV